MITVGYGSYFDHVLQWWNHRHDENVYFLKYEDVKKVGEIKDDMSVFSDVKYFGYLQCSLLANTVLCLGRYLEHGVDNSNNNNDDVGKNLRIHFSQGCVLFCILTVAVSLLRIRMAYR